MAQPQTMMTSGVRQLGTCETAPGLLVVTDIGISPAASLTDPRDPRDRINAFAWKSQPARRGKFSSHCSVANRGGQSRQIDSRVNWHLPGTHAMFVLLFLRIIFPEMGGAHLQRCRVGPDKVSADRKKHRPWRPDLSDP
jgi:hypothetical protein